MAMDITVRCRTGGSKSHGIITTEREKPEMEYEALIEEIEVQCARKQISFYKLSKMSGVPQSTIYGVLKDKNKA